MTCRTHTKQNPDHTRAPLSRRQCVRLSDLPHSISSPPDTGEMSEAKDPTIKLFGMTIPLPELTSSSGGPISAGASSSTPSRPFVNQNWPYSPDDSYSYRLGEDRETDKAPSVIKLSDAKQEDGVLPFTSEEMEDPNSNAVINDNPQTPSADNEASTSKTSKTEEDRNETGNSQEKTLKKPDKILPCPRCNSMDTKFCYFNNYNANQPRHFCKNCKRYWTAGGTMRNVPVGAGPRKNKNSASHYRHIVVPEALTNGVHHPNLKPNGSVLAFGSNTPLCESMASVLNIEERTIQNHAQNGFVKPELRIPVLYGDGEKRDEHSSQSSAIAANSKDEAGKNMPQVARLQNCHSFPRQIPFFSGAPWPYPWNSAQWTTPAFFLPGFPITFHSALPYWGCTLPGTWDVPWVTPLTSPPIQTTPYSGPNSQTLGKHSRDENMLTILSSGQEESEKSDNAERCLWIPKTLRINDPGEAAKSSIWQTLGIKNDKGDSIRNGSLFKAFISKGDKNNHTSETSSVLQVNPAALSRSLDFHESS